VIRLSNYNPYTPPAHDDDAPRYSPGGAVSWDGKLLRVPKQFSFPRVCLKCASPEVHSRRTQRFAFTPTWARLLILVCMLGALVAMALTTKRATLELPLCDACQARWRRARTLSVLMGLAAVASIVGVVVASAGSNSDEGPVAVALVIVVLVVAMAVAMRKLVSPRVLQAKHIDESYISLQGVHPVAGEQVAQRSL
jgi:hypothetical protein